MRRKKWIRRGVIAVLLSVASLIGHKVATHMAVQVLRPHVRGLVELGDIESVRILAEARVPELAQEYPSRYFMSHRVTPLTAAGFSRQREIVRCLVVNGYAQGDAGHGSMYQAAWSGDVEMVKLLLKHGVAINNTMFEYPPMVAAAASGNVELAEFLYEHGAKVWHLSRNCPQPLNRAASPENVEMMRFLLERGAWVDCQWKWFDTTPLMSVVSVEAIELLLAHGANVDLQNSSGRTALSLWVPCSQKKRLELLLGRGADVNIPDKKGKTALDHSHPSHRKLLRSYGAKTGAELKAEKLRVAEKAVAM